MDHVRAVVIGGGVVGCSVLYHLALRGCTDALLLERDELTSGSTWHAAGNCPTFSTGWATMRLQAASSALYRGLGETVGYPIGAHWTGSVRLAHTPERMDEYRHVLGMARALGLDYALLTPAELAVRHPLCDTAGLLGALWDPHDGDIDPAQLTQAFAKGARDLGARIRRFERVIGLRRQADAWHVQTTSGEVMADIVVNAAGFRAGEIMALLGQHLPVVSMSHQYLVTEPVAALAGAARLPLLRDPDDSYYLRQERDGLLLGPYERQATPMWQDGIPDDFAHKLWDDDLARLEPIIEAACARAPALATAGVRRVVNGPIPYTPDGNPQLGPAPGLPDFWHANSFSFGITQAGGAGALLADWILDGAPPWDCWPLDPRRFGAWATPAYAVARAVEVYQHEYAPAFPNEERPAGRPLATSPLHDALRAKGARFGARGGWERPLWFGAAPERPGEDALSFRRARVWHERVGREVAAVRAGAGLLDLPGLASCLVDGPGAARWLDHLLCSRLPREGRLALGYALDRRGGIVSEFLVARLATDRFQLWSAAAAAVHDADILRAARPGGAGTALYETSAERAALVLAGPRARDVLAALTPADLANAAFPWLAVREIEVAGVQVQALRAGEVGELGWELHAAPEHLPHLYAALHDAGARHGLIDFGLYAAEAMRLEKCHPAWKVDLDTGVSPLEAGLARFVDGSKPHFVGRDALLAERQRGPSRHLVPLVLDEPGDVDALPMSAVFAGHARAGFVTSGGWGFAIERSIALALLDTAHAAPGTELGVIVLGERRAATVAAAPFYDPSNARPRA